MPQMGPTKFIQHLRPKFSRRTVVFLACLGLSGVFWLLTSLSKNYVEVIEIPITYKNLPEDMLVVNELSDHIDAEVKIYGFDMLWYWLHFNRIQLPIDVTPSSMRTIRQNGREIYIFLTDEKKTNIAAELNEQFQLLHISPDTLFIRLAPIFTRKVPVKLNAEISFGRQYGMVDQPHLQPDSVLLSGLKELIDTIPFVETESGQWHELSESVSATMNLKHFDDNRLIRFSHAQIEVELNVVEFTEGKLTVPLHVIAKDPQKVKIFPQQVDVTYQVPLATYENVRAEQFQVSVTLIQSATKEVKRLSVNVDAYPSNVRQIRVDPSQVEFIIQK